MVPGGRLPRPAAKIKSILVGSVIQILRYYFLRKRVSKLLPAAGFTPIVSFHRNEKEANLLAKECGGLAVQINLSDDQSITSAIEVISSSIGNTGSLAGVVLGASPAPDLLPFTNITSDILLNQFQVNVVGSHLLLSGLIKQCFRKNKAGIVIGILTQAMGSESRLPATGMSAYVIAKAALKGMLLVCAAEYSWLKVRTITPGFTKTKMLEVFDPRYLELAQTQKPFSSPQEIAQLIIKEILS